MATSLLSPVAHIGEVVIAAAQQSARVAIRPYRAGITAYLRGRLGEDVPLYVQRIGGDTVAAHLGAVAALDRAYGVVPPENARHLRAALAACGIYYHHLLRLFFSRTTGASGVAVLVATGAALPVGDVIAALHQVRDVIAVLGGRDLTPERGVPGGMTQGLMEDELHRVRATAAALREFAVAAEAAFRTHGVEWVKHNEMEIPLPAVAVVTADGNASLYTGDVRVVDPQGNTLIHGDLDAAVAFLTGDAPYRTGPLARFNASNGMPTPRAQEALDRLTAELGGPPLHRAAAVHWLTVIELVAAAELAEEELEQVEPGDFGLRAPLSTPGSGTAAIAASDGVMAYRIALDARGLVTDAEVVVPQPAREVNAALDAVVGDVDPERVDDETITLIEDVMRVYQPAFVPTAPFVMRVTARASDGTTIGQWRRP